MRPRLPVSAPSRQAGSLTCPGHGPMQCVEEMVSEFEREKPSPSATATAANPNGWNYGTAFAGTVYWLNGDETLPDICDRIDNDA